MRALLGVVTTAAVIAVLGSTAAADAELAIVGGSDRPAVKTALANSPIGAYSDRALDVTCAQDPSCLIKLAGDLNARRLVAIAAVTVAGKNLKLELLLVDRTANVLLGSRTVDVVEKKAGRELGPQIKKFVDEATIEKAKAVFADGNTNYNLGTFDKALELYKLAYLIKPLPGFQFNIAQCHRKLAHHSDAIAMYQNYLVGVPDAANKDLVDGLIAEEKKAIVDAQAHADEQAKMNAETERKKAEEGRKAKEADATAAAERRKQDQNRIAHEKSLYNTHPARKWAYLTIAAGLAAGGAGVYFGLQTKDQQRKFDDHGCGDPAQLLTGAELSACGSFTDAGQRDALLTNISVAAGGAFLATGVILLFVDPGNKERPERARASVAVTPSSIQAVIPW